MIEVSHPKHKELEQMIPLVSPQVGLREDLSDLIALADAKNTPLVTMAKKMKDAVNPLFQWQVDAYDDPRFDGVMSNADAEEFNNPTKKRALLYGRIQKFWRTPGIDDFAANVADVAGIGRKGEMARAVSKGIEELKRDIESAFCSSRDSREQKIDQPSRTRGLGAWIQNDAQGDLPVPAEYRTPATSIDHTPIDSLTEENVQSVLQSIYGQTGQRKHFVILCGPQVKRKFTHFTRTQFNSANVASTIRVFTEELDRKKFTSCIDLFEGDFGWLELHPSLFLSRDKDDKAQAQTGYVLDMDLVGISYNRRPRFRQLEDRGGGPRGIIDGIAGLMVENPLALGKFSPGTPQQPKK